MEQPSKSAKLKQKVGEKRSRNQSDEATDDDDCVPLIRRSSRTRSNKPPDVGQSEGQGRQSKPVTRSMVPIMDSEQEVGVLPKLIFTREEIPPDGRINIASKPDLICKVKKALCDTDEMDILLGSPFGRLFQLPTNLCATSGKIIHQFLCRMVITLKKHEIWFVFGGKPIRFSLTEFANVTGLNCGPLPHEDVVNKMKKTPHGQKPYWDSLLVPLLGPKRALSVSEVSDVLLADKTSPTGRYLSGDVRLALALIVLIDGVIAPIASSPRVREETVEMMKDLNTALTYPWGREAFTNTIKMVILGEEYKSVAELKSRLCDQTHLSVHGFPLSIQLAIFKAVPKLHALLPKKKEATELLCPGVDTVGYLRNIRTSGIIEIEESDDLVVHPYVDFGFDLVNEDVSWDDERQDSKVQNVVDRIKRGFKFQPGHWQVWGQKVLRDQSPKKKAAGGRTPKKSSTKEGATNRTNADTGPERYVGEELLNVPHINWGNPDDAVPELLKWLEEQREKDLAERTKWWDDQRDHDLGKKTNMWNKFGEQLVASYCSYHSEKPSEKGEKQQDLPTTDVEDVTHEYDKQKKGTSVDAPEDIDWDRLQKDLDREILAQKNVRPTDTSMSMPEECHLSQIEHMDIDNANVDNEPETVSQTPTKTVCLALPAVYMTPQPGQVTPTTKQVIPNQVDKTAGESSQGSSTDDDGRLEETDEAVHCSNMEAPTDTVEASPLADPLVSATQELQHQVPYVSGRGQPTNLEPGSDKIAVHITTTELLPPIEGQFQQPNPEVGVAGGEDDASEELPGGHPEKPLRDDSNLASSAFTSAAEDPGVHVQSVSEGRQPANQGMGSDEITVQETSSELVPPVQDVEGLREGGENANVDHGDAKFQDDVSEEFPGDNREETLPDDSNILGEQAPLTDHLKDDEENPEDYLRDHPMESDDEVEEPIADLLQPAGEEIDPTFLESSIDKDGSEAEENIVQESSTKKKRARRKTKRLVEETSGKKHGRRERKLSKVFLSTLKSDEGREYTVNNLTVTKKFFEQLYTPTNHVSSEHLEAVLSVIWNRHSESLLTERVAILDTIFTRTVLDDYKAFKKLRSGHGQFAWNKLIQRYVKGDVDGRGMGLAWIIDVDEVYMPMFWQKNHWVAICINLRTGIVHIMDSNINLTKEGKVKEAMQPLLNSLPHIIKTCVQQEKCKYDVPGEFVYERDAEVPQNARSGDCGLLTVRYIERLSQGLTLDKMDNDAVDKIRMSYAIQVYESFVKPL